MSDDPRHRRQVYGGLGLGILASLGTWAAARILIPLGGAGRELIEGITALLAVVVLVYVSNWLFQKTYVHDWKEYLETRVGRSLTAGSALAMASLAFAAVYREGFETVLFYQALPFDVGAGALLAGFLLQPNHVQGLASVLRRQGRLGEALSYFEQLAILDPLDPNHVHSLAFTHQLLRSYPAADEL